MKKRVREEIFYLHEFKRMDGRGWLTDGETIASVISLTATDIATGEDVSAAMVSNMAPYNDKYVRYMLSGGTFGKRYLLNFLVTTSNGQTFEDEIIFEII